MHAAHCPSPHQTSNSGTMTVTANPENIPRKTIGTPSPNITYATRLAFRVIAFNLAGQIAISHPWENFRYRLPGGYTDLSTSLNHAAAARHELEWETGGRIRPKDLPPMACVDEYRDDVQVHQITWCYLAELVNVDAEDGVTDEMLNEKLKLEWMEVGEARRRFEEEEPTAEVGGIVKERDWFFLEVATGKQLS